IVAVDERANGSSQSAQVKRSPQVQRYRVDEGGRRLLSSEPQRGLPVRQWHGRGGSSLALRGRPLQNCPTSGPKGGACPHAPGPVTAGVATSHPTPAMSLFPPLRINPRTDSSITLLD